MKAAAPTAKQIELLDYLTEFHAREGRMPSIREIARDFGLESTRSVVGRLDGLEERGLIQRHRGKILLPAGADLTAEETLLVASLAKLPASRLYLVTSCARLRRRGTGEVRG